jgi:hypothetical protein
VLQIKRRILNNDYLFVLDKKMPEQFGIQIGENTQQPYSKEVNIIDVAGVCWHFVE